MRRRSQEFVDESFACSKYDHGRVALVTGAGGGIGRATVERLAADGAAVVAGDLRGHEPLVEAARAAGGRALGLELDVTSAACDRIQHPQAVAGQRVSALRLSDGRVLALFQALCQVAPRPAGFRRRELRPVVAGLLGRGLEHYSAGAMTYDLRRLRLHGLIQRQPHSFRYRPTPAGLHLAFSLSRIVLRLLQPGWAALLVPCATIPAPLREALTRLDAALADLPQAT